MKKSLRFIILIFLFFVIIRLVGITYGFYEMVIIGNTNNHSANVNSKKLSVNYTDGTAKMNFKGDYLFPGDTAEKSFTVQNTGDSSANYSIILDNVTNTFTRIQDLRYYLYINNTLVDEGAINNDEMQYLYYKENLAVNSSDSVKFVFKYAETDEVQNEDMNKNLSFRVNIVGDVKTNVNSENNNAVVNLNNSDTLSSYRIYGNSIQDGTPSPSNPVEIESVGDLITDTTDTNYGKYKIPVTVSGKNLFDKQSAIKGDYFYLANGQSTTNSSISVYYINAISGEQYSYLKTEENSNYIRVTLCDANKNFILRVGAFTNNSGTFETTDTTFYIQIAVDNAILDKVQIEKSNTATEYEPYYNETTNIFLDEPLRKVGNVSDYIDLKRQVVVRNVAVNDSAGTKSISESYSALSAPLIKNINLPKLSLHNGTNIIKVGTSTSPSKIELEYYKK